MLQENRVKRVMAEGKLALAGYVTFADPSLLEIMGIAGLDAAFIDMEHSNYDLRLVSEMVRACDLAGITSVVRPPENDWGVILRLLDMGAQGIYIPHVNGVEGARQAIDAVRYPPMGHRGAAGGSRAAGYGSVPWQQHMARSNREIFLAVMIEDQKAIDELNDIAALGWFGCGFRRPHRPLRHPRRHRSPGPQAESLRRRLGNPCPSRWQGQVGLSRRSSCLPHQRTRSGANGRGLQQHGPHAHVSCPQRPAPRRGQNPRLPEPGSNRLGSPCPNYPMSKPPAATS